MISSSDNFLAEMSKWAMAQTPIRFHFKSESIKLQMCGYVFGSEQGEVEIASDPREVPFSRFKFTVTGLLRAEEKGFDVAVLETFGKLFDDLPMGAERGRLEAHKFEIAWVLHFSSGAVCVLERVPMPKM